MMALAWLVAGLAAYAAPSASGDYLYTVKPQDTLSDIGRRGLEPASAYREVWRLNHVAIDRKMPVGEVLHIPWRLLKTSPIDATVEDFGGSATATQGLDRRSLTRGLVLHEGAVIATGANAFVRLALPDGTHMAVPSNSRIRLDRLRRVALTDAVDRQISVQSGGLESKVTPMTNPSSRYVIITPVAQSSVRGTEFRVHFDANQAKAASGVLKGEVGVSDHKAELIAPAGQGVVATPKGLEGPFPLLPAPIPVAASALQSSAKLHFELRPVAGAAQYRFAVGRDARVEAPIFETLSVKPVVDAPGLEEGVYFLRVSAISRDGLEGEAGVTSFICSPGQLSILGASPIAPGKTEFRWAAPGEAGARFRFVLARRGDPDHPLINRSELVEDRFVADTPPGDYVWMVFAERFVDGRRIEIVSDPQSLHVP